METVKTKVKREHLRQSNHDRSAVPDGDESAKVPTSLLDFLEVLRVHYWFRHERIGRRNRRLCGIEGKSKAKTATNQTIELKATIGVWIYWIGLAGEKLERFIVIIIILFFVIILLLKVIMVQRN